MQAGVEASRREGRVPSESLQTVELGFLFDGTPNGQSFRNPSMEGVDKRLVIVHLHSRSEIKRAHGGCRHPVLHATNTSLEGFPTVQHSADTLGDATCLYPGWGRATQLLAEVPNLVPHAVRCAWKNLRPQSNRANNHSRYIGGHDEKDGHVVVRKSQQCSLRRRKRGVAEGASVFSGDARISTPSQRCFYAGTPIMPTPMLGMVAPSR